MLQLIDNCAQTVCSESIPNVSIVFEQMYLPLHPLLTAPTSARVPFFFVCLSPPISTSPNVVYRYKRQLDEVIQGARTHLLSA